MGLAQRQDDIDINPLVDKIRSASSDAKRTIARFVDFVIHEEGHSEAWPAMAMSEESFAKVWDNPEDAVYDEL